MFAHDLKLFSYFSKPQLPCKKKKFLIFSFPPAKMKIENLLVSLLPILFTTGTQLYVVQAFYCIPTDGNITTLSKEHYCECLFDDQGGWIVYDKDLLFPPSSSAQQQNDKLLNNTTGGPDSTVHVADDDDDNDDEITATSTYDGIKSTCIIRRDRENHAFTATGGKHLVYCPYDVFKNTMGRHNVTLVVTRSIRHRTLDINNKTVTTTTATIKWARYFLPQTILYCKCSISQTWSWKMLKWDSIQVDWKIPKTAAKYLSKLTGAQTKVFFKQGDDDAQKREVCEEITTEDYQCTVHKITELVDIWRTFAICVMTTVASCWPPSLVELCTNVTLKPDLVWDHFKFVDSEMKCATNDDGGDGGIHISWGTENPIEMKPSGLVYSIALLDSNNRVVSSRIVNDTDARGCTFNARDTETFTSARLNLCVRSPSATTDVISKCGNTKFFKCTRKGNESMYQLLFLIFIPVIMGVVGVAYCHSRRKRKRELSQRRNCDSVEFDVIVNDCYKNHRQKPDDNDEPKYEEIDTDTKFDTIDLQAGSGG